MHRGLIWPQNGTLCRRPDKVYLASPDPDGQCRQYQAPLAPLHTSHTTIRREQALCNRLHSEIMRSAVLGSIRRRLMDWRPIPVGNQGEGNASKRRGGIENAQRKHGARRCCRRISRVGRGGIRPRTNADAGAAAHQRRGHHRRIGRPAAARSLHSGRGQHDPRSHPRRRRRAGRRAGARSRRQIHHSGIVQFPCPLGSVDGRALRQSWRDVRDGAGQRAEGGAPAQPGYGRCPAPVPQRRPSSLPGHHPGRRDPSSGAHMARHRARPGVVSDP